MSNKKASPWVKDTSKTIAKWVVSLVNLQRARADGEPMDYVQLNLPAEMPPLPDTRNFIQQRVLGKSPLSLYEIEQAFDRIADSAHVKGIILTLNGFAMPFADLMTLRDSIGRLQARGKRVICYAQTYDMGSYFVASCADEIWLQPGGMLMTTGLVQQQVYLKHALDTVGLEADVVAISPFKSAADQLTLMEPSAEAKSQTEWLLDSAYSIIVGNVAKSRHLSEEAVHAMIDESPFTDLDALELGYVDYLCNEEGFSKRLESAQIVLWETANQRLPLKMNFSDQIVAVLPMFGTIVNGNSAEPPVDIPLPLVGGNRVGDTSAVQQIRQLMKNDDVKAVVVYVDSPGGSSTASEAITSALDELAKTRPVVIYMGAVAASGGYYIATAGDWIVAQPSTITGSIGVFSLKLVNNEALKKLRFNPFYYLRGKNASIFTPMQKFTESERTKMRQTIERVYEVFVQRVADARKMKTNEVDAIGGGRVWTGTQALENGLVDELGGLHEAIAKAKALAKLSDDAAVRIVRGGSNQPLTAQLAEKVDPAAALRYWYTGVTSLTSGQTLYLTPFDLR